MAQVKTVVRAVVVVLAVGVGMAEACDFLFDMGHAFVRIVVIVKSVEYDAYIHVGIFAYLSGHFACPGFNRVVKRAFIILRHCGANKQPR